MLLRSLIHNKTARAVSAGIALDGMGLNASGISRYHSTSIRLTKWIRASFIVFAHGTVAIAEIAGNFGGRLLRSRLT